MLLPFVLLLGYYYCNCYGFCCYCYYCYCCLAMLRNKSTGMTAADERLSVVEYCSIVELLLLLLVLLFLGDIAAATALETLENRSKEAPMAL